MENTAKNFALQLGSLIALYTSVTSLLVALFGIITLAYPDAADSYWQYENASQSIRFAIAVLIVFFPTYLLLTRKVNTIRRKEHGTYLTLTKWLIYLSLLVGGAVLLGDFVAVINGFLSGELTIRFILKALSLLVIVGAAFFYYLMDVKGYWQEDEKKSIQYGAGATVVVIAVLVLGFFHIEPPSEVREMRIDQNQINDLSQIQWQIEEYYVVNGLLPESLDEIYGEDGLEMPTAPEGRAGYEYNVTSSSTFELCAEFASPSRESAYPEYSMARPLSPQDAGIKNPNSWEHGAGEWCFERVVQ